MGEEMKRRNYSYFIEISFLSSNSSSFKLSRGFVRSTWHNPGADDMTGHMRHERTMMETKLQSHQDNFLSHFSCGWTENVFVFSFSSSLLSLFFCCSFAADYMKMSLNYMVEIGRVCNMKKVFFLAYLEARVRGCNDDNWVKERFPAPNIVCVLLIVEFQLIISLCERFQISTLRETKTFPRDMPCSSDQTHKRQSFRSHQLNGKGGEERNLGL